MKKVSELEGREIDRWVAEALGYVWVDVSSLYADGDRRVLVSPDLAPTFIETLKLQSRRGIEWDACLPKFSRIWVYGGPIIEQEQISITHIPGDSATEPFWAAQTMIGEQYGPTPLIAAMRAFVANKFGEEVPEMAP